jgi:uncharacterized membrane protein (DUF4010 family)
LLGLQIGAILAKAAGPRRVLCCERGRGFVSSASAVASAASLAASGKLPPDVAGTGGILASVVSALVNVPLVARLTRDRALSRRLAWVLGVVVLLGLAGTAVQAWAQRDSAGAGATCDGLVPRIEGLAQPKRMEAHGR